MDSHAHIGFYNGKNYTGRDLLEAMDDAGVSSALVSNLDALTGPQKKANEKTQREVKKRKGRMFGLAWVNPKENDEVFEDARNCLRDSATFRGLKFLPSDNAYAFDDTSIDIYMELAGMYDVPVVVHTTDDEYSSPRQVCAVARRHPETNIVMYHTCLGDESCEGKHEAISYASRLPNLYVETSWLEAPFIAEAVRRAGADKVVFGSDAPFEGRHHYKNPLQRLSAASLNERDLRKVVYGNSRKLFGIND